MITRIVCITHKLSILMCCEPNTILLWWPNIRKTIDFFAQHLDGLGRQHENCHSFVCLSLAHANAHAIMTSSPMTIHHMSNHTCFSLYKVVHRYESYERAVVQSWTALSTVKIRERRGQSYEYRNEQLSTRWTLKCIRHARMYIWNMVDAFVALVYLKCPGQYLR